CAAQKTTVAAVSLYKSTVAPQSRAASDSTPSGRLYAGTERLSQSAPSFVAIRGASSPATAYVHLSIAVGVFAVEVDPLALLPHGRSATGRAVRILARTQRRSVVPAAARCVNETSELPTCLRALDPELPV